jgi:Family of unknown function (DUF6011)
MNNPNTSSSTSVPVIKPAKVRKARTSKAEKTALVAGTWYPPAHQLVCSHCMICGRTLVDSYSIQMSIGPICREKFGFNEDAEFPMDGDKVRQLLELAVKENGLDPVFVEKVLLQSDIADVRTEKQPHQRRAVNLLVWRGSLERSKGNEADNKLISIIVAAIWYVGYRRVAERASQEVGAVVVRTITDSKGVSLLSVIAPFNMLFQYALKSITGGAARFNRDEKTWELFATKKNEVWEAIKAHHTKGTLIMGARPAIL